MSSLSTKLREAGSPKPARRRSRRPFSATHVLIAVVVILAFVLNLLVLRDRSSTTLVGVAEEAMAVGSVLNPDSLRFVPVDSGFEPMQHLLTEESFPNHEGWVLNRAISEGGLVEKSALAQPGDGSGLRTMSLPVDREHAAGGNLIPGDRVDVISVEDGAPRYVAVDLEVTGVAEGSPGAIGAVSEYHIVLSVTSDQALSLAGAMDSGSLEIVRSTGADPIAQPTEPDDS